MLDYLPVNSPEVIVFIWTTVFLQNAVQLVEPIRRHGSQDPAGYYFYIFIVGVFLQTHRAQFHP